MKKIRKKYLAFGSPDFTSQEINAVTKVLKSGWVGMGPQTIAFEEELSNYLDVSNIILVNSCTSALFLALLANNIGPGDEVIVPSLTWCATANAVLYLGAKPIFCDVDLGSFSVTPELIQEKITKKTKAIIPVHFGGYAIDTSQIREALPRDNIAIIEDAAHAIGSSYQNGKKVGSSESITCFSFYANKNISTADGGALALNDNVKAEIIRSLRLNGMSSNAWSRYISPKTEKVSGLKQLGYKMNYTDLQASIGRIQLKRLDIMNAQRSKLAKRYQNQIKKANLDILFQSGVFSDGHAKHLFIGLIDKEKLGISRDQLFIELRKRNIGVAVHYQPLHEMPLYKSGLRYDLKNTEKLGSQLITFPISAKMENQDVDYVVDHLADIISSV